MCDLNDILEKYRQGDREAAGRLYRIYASEMLALCMRYSRDRTEAEDNLQDGFVRLFEALHQYSGKGSFEGWMKRIFVHISLEKYRKNKSLLFREELPEYSEDEPEPVPEIPVSVLSRFVEELPERYRLIFHLYVMEELSHKEIASFAGISEGTSKSNLARARDILKKKIKQYLEYGR